MRLPGHSRLAPKLEQLRLSWRWHTRMRQHRCFFIIGHMRAGSTLLVHLLANHPEINCFGESHIFYRFRSHFLELYDKCHSIQPKSARWFGDKVLHTSRTRDPELVFAHVERFLVIYRHPEPALKSMVTGDIELDFDAPRTLDNYRAYYTERLSTIGDWVDQLPPSRKAFVDYANLCAHPKEQLAMLTRFFGLSSPLKPEYRELPTTGQVGIGDPSETIRSGVIRPRQPEPEVANPVYADAASLAAYQAMQQRDPFTF